MVELRVYLHLILLWSAHEILSLPNLQHSFTQENHFFLDLFNYQILNAYPVIILPWV